VAVGGQAAVGRLDLTREGFVVRLKGTAPAIEVDGEAKAESALAAALPAPALLAAAAVVAWVLDKVLTWSLRP